MRNFLYFLALACLGLALPAAAETPAETFRAMALDGDTDGAEAAMEAAHRGSLSGEVSFDDLRDMFSVFTTTDPRIWEFAEFWMEDYPDSTYAHTAFAWLYYTSGRHMRGTDLAIFTYLEASQRSQDDFDRAGRLVNVAVKQAPDLVPASDAVLALNLVRREGRGRELLGYIMDRAPNYGSVKRALASAQPKWGGTFDDALFICGTYAGMVPDVPDYDAGVCLIDAAFTYDYGDHVRDEARKALRKNDHPLLEHARHKNLKPGLTPAGDARVRDYLEGPGATDTEMAAAYDHAVAEPRGTELYSARVYAALRAQSLEALKNDPYNPDLAEFVTRQYAGDRLVADRMPAEEALALLKSTLQVAPFDPRVWHTIGEYINDLDRAPLNAAKNVYYENAIAYSHHSPDYIRFYLQRKSRDYFERKENNNNSEISAADQAEFDKAVSCPLVRAIRLADLMCQELPGNGIPCDNVTPGAPKYADLMANLNDRKACVAERLSDLRDVMFQPADPETGASSN